MSPIANWSYPTSIRFGAGRISELAEAVRATGMSRPLLVTDIVLAALPITQNALDQLDGAGLKPGLFSEVQANPTDANLEVGVAAPKTPAHYVRVRVLNASGELVPDVSVNLRAKRFLQDADTVASAVSDAEGRTLLHSTKLLTRGGENRLHARSVLVSRRAEPGDRRKSTDDSLFKTRGTAILRFLRLINRLANRMGRVPSPIQ